MKTLKAFSLLVLLFYLNSCKTAKIKSFASRAISSILGENFLKTSQAVDLISFGVKSGKSEILMTEILRCQSHLTVTTKFGAVDPSKRNLNTSSVLVFDSVENFEKFRDDIVWQTHNATRHEHLVYIPNVTVADLEKIQDGFSIDTVNFVMNETQESIDLVTGFMFSPNKCRSNQFVTINRFVKSIMQWKSSAVSVRKYQNFHGCNLVLGRVNVLNCVNCYFELAKHLNYKFEYHAITSLEKVYSLEIVDLYEIGLHPELVELKGGVVGFPFQYDDLTFFIPPGEPMTPIEKLFLPYELEVWIAISITLLIGFMTIQVINRFPPTVRKFVFGQRNTTPTLNMVSTFLTGYQSTMPGRNFARFFLMLFIIWCLIIRTCYQSKLFKHLQSDNRYPEMKTFAEMVQHNFTFYDSESNCNGILLMAQEEGLRR